MRTKKPLKIDIYAMTWRLPIIVWQVLFFIGPVIFMIAMSFFLVKNYRMTEAFEFVNWSKMFSKNYFWDSYFYTIIIASLSTILAMGLAFPASFALAFKANEKLRRWAIFLLIIPFFTSYLVRTFSWFVILSENGVVNALLGYIGLGLAGLKQVIGPENHKNEDSSIFRKVNISMYQLNTDQFVRRSLWPFLFLNFR